MNNYKYSNPRDIKHPKMGQNIRMDTAAGPGRSADFTVLTSGDPDFLVNSPDPRLLLKLPDTASRLVAKYLPNKDFSSLGQVSKDTNTRTGKYAPSIDECIKRSADQLEEISVKYLANRLFYNSAVNEEAFKFNLLRGPGIRNNPERRMKLKQSAENVEMLKQARESDKVAKEATKEKLVLLCKEAVDRSKEGKKDVLDRYFTAANFFPLQMGSGDFVLENRGPGSGMDNYGLDDGIPYRRFEWFKTACDQQVRFLETVPDILVYPEVKQWYANLICAFFFIRHPGGPRTFKETLKEQGPALNPEFLQLLELFRSMGATKDGLQAIWGKALPAVREMEKTWEGRIFSRRPYPYSSEFSEDPMSVVEEYFGEYMREWS